VGPAEPHANPFARLLTELKASDGKRYLVLLIRPNGIDAFENCEAIAGARKLAIGKDALLGGGRLVFADARQARVVPAEEDER